MPEIVRIAWQQQAPAGLLIQNLIYSIKLMCFICVIYFQILVIVDALFVSVSS